MIDRGKEGKKEHWESTRTSSIDYINQSKLSNVLFVGGIVRAIKQLIFFY
jgi:hypothetical protein